MKVPDNIESLLLAYVDKRLNEEDRLVVEKLASERPEIGQQLQDLRTSDLPFKAAFESDLQREIPVRIVDTIESWAEPETRTNTAVGSTLPRFVGYAVSLIVGVVIGLGTAHWTSGSKSQSVAPWLAQVASYHELYVRETVAEASSNDEARAQLSQRMKQLFGFPIPIPDLTSEGLEFKRGQVLQIDGSPLIQLAYLPQEGKPVVLCLTRRGEADREFEFGSSHNLQFANWTEGGISYVMLGSLESIQLNKSAQIAASQL